MNDAAAAVGSFKEWRDDLRLAVGLLTRVPIPHPDGAAPSYLSRALRVFPLVGVAIGAVVGLVDLGLLALGAPPLAAAALTVGCGGALTGALHEDGLADFADGFGGYEKSRKLEIMRDSRLGTFGGLALMVGFTARLAALAAIPWSVVIPALIAAHALGRAAIPVLSVRLPFARTDGLAAGVGHPPTAIAVTAVALGVVVALLCLPLREGLLAVVLAAAASAGIGLLAVRQLGGQTGDVLGAAEQSVEIAVLILCAARFG